MSKNKHVDSLNLHFEGTEKINTQTLYITSQYHFVHPQHSLFGQDLLQDALHKPRKCKLVALTASSIYAYCTEVRGAVVEEIMILHIWLKLTPDSLKSS